MDRISQVEFLMGLGVPLEAAAESVIERVGPATKAELRDEERTWAKNALKEELIRMGAPRSFLESATLEQQLAFYKRGLTPAALKGMLDASEARELALEVLREVPGDMASDLTESVHAGGLTGGVNIREAVELSEAQMDNAQYIARGVTLIRAGFSTNKTAGLPRYYPSETLAGAASVFEGVSSYANHPGRDEIRNRPERDIRDKTGYFEGVRFEGGRLRADYHVVGQAREWLWPMIVETRRKPDYVQLSINAEGKMHTGVVEGQNATIIESIVSAKSVDAVTSGAAGGGFAGAMFESDRGGTHPAAPRRHNSYITIVNAPLRSIFG